MTSPSATETGRTMRPETEKVWDPVVRIFHWSLLSFFTFAYFTGDEWGWAHERAGYVVTSLVALRIVWGLIGSKHARFSDYVYRPSTVFAFLRDSIKLNAARFKGHNPAGGAMVIALLVAITVISASGYMMTMDMFWGAQWVEDIHEIVVNSTLGLIALHVIGVGLASFEHKENLVKSMFTGRKRKE